VSRLALLNLAAGVLIIILGALFVLSPYDFVVFLGAVLILLGIMTLGVWYGLRHALEWAKLVGMFSSVVYMVIGVLLLYSLSVAFTGFSFLVAVLSIAFGALEFYTMTRPRTKAYLVN